MTDKQVISGLKKLLSAKKKTFTKDEAETIKEAIDIAGANQTLKTMLSNAHRKIETLRKYEVVEFCPHCEYEAAVYWDVEREGHSIFCPYCGKRIMLCSQCPERDGEMQCDWQENKTPCCSWDNYSESSNEN